MQLADTIRSSRSFLRATGPCTRWMTAPLFDLGMPRLVTTAGPYRIGSVEVVASGRNIVEDTVAYGSLLSLTVTLDVDRTPAGDGVCLEILGINRSADRFTVAGGFQAHIWRIENVPDDGTLVLDLDVRIRPDAPLGPFDLTVYVFDHDSSTGTHRFSDSVSLQSAVVAPRPKPPRSVLGVTTKPSWKGGRTQQRP